MTTSASSVPKGSPSLGGQVASPKMGASVVSGMLSGLVTLTYSVSYAALIFKGPLADRLDVGIGMALMSAVVVALLVALRSSFVFAIAGPDSNASAILALMAGAIATGASTSTEALSSVMMALALSSVVVGIILYTIGRLKLGYLVRYIPYPVLGGFLAGTGWLIAKGAFSVMTGQSLSLAKLDILHQWTWVKLWIPGLVLALVMIAVMKRFKHYLVFPSLILGAMLFSHLVLYLMGVSMSEAVEMGWLYRPFEQQPSAYVWGELVVNEINWTLILAQSGNLVAMTGVVIITILLNATGIELSSQEDADLNRELSAAGVANLASGLLGGIIGYQSISRSLLNFRAGGLLRFSGVVAASFCALFFLGASSLLATIPKLVLGGLLLYLGLGLLKEWVWDAWRKLSHVDYMMVMGILFVIAAMGFLEGVAFGLVISVVLFVVSYSQINIVKTVVTGNVQRSSFSRPLTHLKVLKDKARSILILNLHGYLFFGTANSLLEQVKAKVEADQEVPLKSVILDFRLVTGLDSSVTLSFQKILQISQKMGVDIYMTDLTSEMRDYFLDAALIQEDSSGYRTFPTLDYCVQWCEDALLKEEGVVARPELPSIESALTEMFLQPWLVDGFMKYLNKQTFEKNETVCPQGAPAESMFFVASGLVTAQLEIPGREPIRLITMGSGTVFGEMGLYTMAPRSAAVVTDEQTELYELNDEQLQLMQKDDPEMATALHRFIIRLLAERLSQTNSKVQHLT